MNKYKIIIIVIIFFLLGFYISNIFDRTDAKISIGKTIVYSVISENGIIRPIKVSAFGKLALLKDQPEEMSQIISLDLINNIILMKEGIVFKDGTITMSNVRYLEILSLSDKKIIAKDEVWTVTIQKDSVTFLDNRGVVGELKNGYIGKYEY